jgi:hypothetical protein
VGVACFFIDLAVVDPETPGRYLLGIECDGANYHSSRSARDRDRIREAVLSDRGWIIHRIWSTDWFHRPEDEVRKTLAAIEAARAEWASRLDSIVPPAAETTQESVPVIRRESVEEADCEGNGCCPTKPYQIASFRVNTFQEIHELGPAELGRVVARIIDQEGPIHQEEIARRVTQLWGLQRTGRRIREAVGQALKVASGVTHDGDFYASAGLSDIAVRDRSDVEYNTVRKPTMLPPAEIRKAVTAIVQVHLGVSRDEAVTEAARLFGFKSTSARLRSVIEREIDLLLDDTILQERNGKLYAEDAINA